MASNQSYLPKEQEEVCDLLFKYRRACSPRDELGTCPSIEVDLQLIDKSPFFHKTFSCSRERQRNNRSRNAKISTSRYSKAECVSILFTHHAHCQKDYKFEKDPCWFYCFEQ